MADGPSHEIVSIYMDSEKGTKAERTWPEMSEAPGDSIVRLRSVRLRTEEGNITDAIQEEATRKAFNIPKKYKRVCITPIGIPVEWPTKKKKEIGEFLAKETF